MAFSHLWETLRVLHDLCCSSEATRRQPHLASSFSALSCACQRLLTQNLLMAHNAQSICLNLRLKYT